MALQLASRMCTRQLFACSRALSMYYTQFHEWVTVEGSKCKVGITDYAQSALGDVVYVQLPDVGEEFEKEEEMASVESVKAVGEIMAPVGGIVTAVNEKLDSEPGTINTHPESEAWMVEMEISDTAELDELMDRSAYDTFLETDDH